MAVYMKMIAQGIDKLVITDASGSESGEATLDEFSQKLGEFYVQRGCNIESQRTGNSLNFLVKKGTSKFLEVLVTPRTHKKHEDRRDGDYMVYYTHSFSAKFNGPLSLVQDHRDAFRSEYA